MATKKSPDIAKGYPRAQLVAMLGRLADAVLPGTAIGAAAVWLAFSPTATRRSF